MSDPYLGEVRAFSFNYQPAGWLPCDGRLVPIMDNQALCSLIGTTYGGDGESTIGLPKIPPLEAGGGAGLNYCISVTGSFPPR